ncbi:unnamed protein product [Diamesa tonsa]
MENEVLELVEKLNQLSIEKDATKLTTLLEKLIEAGNLDDYELKINCVKFLESNDSSSKIYVLVAKLIAEVTKTTKQRTNFSEKDIIELLINLLSTTTQSTAKTSESWELIVQLCRALGNILFSNDAARTLVYDYDGGKALVGLFDIKIADVRAAGRTVDEILIFAKVRCGVVSNYLLGKEEISQKSLELKLIEKIKIIMEECLENQFESDMLENLMPPLNILTEQVSDLNFQPEINILITRILKTCTNSDLAETCLELLQYQAENDDVKLLLAKEGLCESIYVLLEKYKNFVGSVETRSLMKLSCDLIVLILTGDDAMKYLNNTPLLTYMQQWLESDDVDLMTTGVLALGNFARTDNHCIKMVEDNVTGKLIEILSKNNGIDGDMRIQHALLSALRNLVIPKQNKISVIEAGLVETILPMLEIHQPPVVFKLLGTLRMTVDGQEKLALELLQNEKLILQLVEWSKTSDLAGVNSESSRLIAWLIKNGYRFNPVAKDQVDLTALKSFILIDGSVEAVAKMLLSPHLVMQNEALIALSIASMIFCEQEPGLKLSEILIACQLGEKLSEFIEQTSENMTNEIIENVQTLVKVLKKSEAMQEHLLASNIDEKLMSVPKLQELCTL